MVTALDNDLTVFRVLGFEVLGVVKAPIITGSKLGNGIVYRVKEAEKPFLLLPQ